ncbi:DUF3828 domain-containing protein [Acinetobacter gerneri]|uniref:DUF3828 domain-containing protein n=1 Tax=Acinetobacter gerneri TaxID=202952 RepID=UPI0029359046|nr:DUF3828 domain-containing protein [Acinetobacter gerneri]MDV2438609.1 DUF3828 domain-containing protein [Acinetobacter gerneri]
MKKILLGFAVMMSAMSSHAATNTCFKSSQDLVKTLYKNYPLNIDAKDISSQKPVILTQYFSKQLVNLLVKDQKCAAKIQGECNLGFNILSNAQDEPEDSQIKILQASPKVVTVKINFQPSAQFIDFVMQQQQGCYLIDDIKYDDHDSLRKILSQK